MFDRVRQFFAPPVFEEDADKTRIARLLNLILWANLVVWVLGLFALPLAENPLAVIPILGAMILPGFGALALMRSGRVQLAGSLFIFILWVAVTGLLLVSDGVRSPMILGYATVIIVAALLLGGRAAIAFAGLTIVSAAGIFLIELNGFLPSALIPIEPVAAFSTFVGNIVIVVALLYIAVGSLNEALDRARGYASELEEQREHLEETIQERTRDLARQSEQLETAAQVARDAAAIQDIDQMLEHTANLISARFGFYHTGIFLLDPSGEWAVLQAASSPGGQQMLMRGHRLRVGMGGIVGYVAGRGEHRIVLNVGDEAIFFDNPDLPHTCSEMAVPLRVRGEIIGVLDVQSLEIEAFTEEDVVVLQTLADQVAVAISNARLLQRVQESLWEERRAFKEIGREAWSEQIRAERDLGYRRTEGGFQPVADLWRPQMVEALRTGSTTVGQRDDATVLSLPVKWRDQVIGVIDAHKRDEAGEWTQDEISLMEAVVEQLGVALESARLHQDTERRAAREEMFGDMTARIRETLDMESVLRTAAHEVRQALGLPEVVIRMARRPPDGGQDGAD
jgi:GAF domain-containing protein